MGEVVGEAGEEEGAEEVLRMTQFLRQTFLQELRQGCVRSSSTTETRTTVVPFLPSVPIFYHKTSPANSSGIPTAGAFPSLCC